MLWYVTQYDVVKSGELLIVPLEPERNAAAPMSELPVGVKMVIDAEAARIVDELACAMRHEPRIIRRHFLSIEGLPPDQDVYAALARRVVALAENVPMINCTAERVFAMPDDVDPTRREPDVSHQLRCEPC